MNPMRIYTDEEGLAEFCETCALAYQATVKVPFESTVSCVACGAVLVPLWEDEPYPDEDLEYEYLTQD